MSQTLAQTTGLTRDPIRLTDARDYRKNQRSALSSRERVRIMFSLICRYVYEVIRAGGGKYKRHR